MVCDNTMTLKSTIIVDFKEYERIKIMQTEHIVASVVNNGGLTLDKDMREFKPQNGYFVGGFSTCHVMDLSDQKGITRAVKQLKSIMTNDDFLGFWLNNNDLYIELSRHVDNKEWALWLGKEFSQIAIYDCTLGGDILT